MTVPDPEQTARELLRMEADQAGQAMRALSVERQRDLVLSIEPGRRRQDLILLSDRPDVLTRSLPPEDFVLTVKEIGDPDALTLVELSSNAQLTYLLDLDLWVQFDLDMGQVDHWLAMLLETGPERLMRWVDHVDFELLVLTFERWCVSVEREALPELPDLVAARVVSPDNYHHILVKVGADLSRVRELIDLIYHRDKDRFLAILGNLGTTPPAELEELSLRWRTARLADRGWPDLEEAIAVYQPLAKDRLSAEALSPKGQTGAPRYPLQQRWPGRLFPAALARLAQSEAREALAMQVANLINRVIIAEGLPASELQTLEQAGLVVAGRLEIGLWELGDRDPEQAAASLTRLPLLHIAQVAQAAILERRSRAFTLAQGPATGLLSLLDPPVPERLVAAARPRPSFVEQPGELPRALAGPDDLRALDGTLDLAEAATGLAEALGIAASDLPDPFTAGSQPESREGLSLQVLLLTALARAHLGLEPLTAPLPADRLDGLAADLPRDPAELAASLRGWAQAAGVEWGESDHLLEALVRLAAEWLTAWDRGDYDPRFVAGPWVLTA